MILYGVAFGVFAPSPKGIGTIDPRILSEDLPLSQLFPEGHVMSAQDILRWCSDLEEFLPLCTPPRHLVSGSNAVK